MKPLEPTTHWNQSEKYPDNKNKVCTKSIPNVKQTNKQTKKPCQMRKHGTVGNKLQQIMRGKMPKCGVEFCPNPETE